MFCKRCGTNIEEGIKFCPNCGEPVGLGADGDTINDVSVTNNTVPPGNVNGGGENQVMSPEFTQGITMESGFKKFITGHKGLLIAGAVAIIALIALILVLCNMTVLANFLRMTFSSPEDYYHYVEKKAVEEISADAGELYGRNFLDNLNVYDMSVSAKMNVTIEEGGRDLMGLAGLAGLDMSWLESVAFTMDSSVKKDAVSMGLGAVVNGVNILTGNFVFDTDSQTVYLQIPELNERYMGVEIPDYSSGDMEEVWEMYEALERVCPDQKKLEQIINRYLMTAVESMDDVSRNKGLLKVEDVEQKCTVLTVTADVNTFKDMAVVLLTQMREDEDIENIIKAAMGEEMLREGLYLDDMSPEEAYGEFQDWIDSEIEDLEDLGEMEVYDDEVLEMKVYVDRKGKIVGRTMEMGDVTIHMLMPEDDGQFGYELSYADSYDDDSDVDDSFALIGTGERNGDKVEGEFVLEFCNTPIMDIAVQELNVRDMRTGLLNGSVTLALSEEAADYMDYTPGAAMIQGVKLSMDFKSDRDSGSCNMGVSLRDRDLVSVEMTYRKEKGYKGIDPGQDAVMVADMDDLLKWGEHFDIGGLTGKLKEADVPSEVTDSLEMFEDMDLESLLRMMYYYY